MTYVGIDVAKDKHDCYIVNSDGEVLAEVFTIPNDQIGFNLLFQKLQSVAPDLSKVKVGLEATGHYSYNLLGFLLEICFGKQKVSAERKPIRLMHIPLLE